MRKKCRKSKRMNRNSNMVQTLWHRYLNGKMISVETTPGGVRGGDEGEWCKG
jgi:hypothetical protein